MRRGELIVAEHHYPSRQQIVSYYERLYPDQEGAKNKRAGNVREELLRLFEEGRGQDIPEIKFTAWAAFNAVTEFVDHYRATRGKTDRDRASSRLESAWFGSGAALKARAWDEAFELAV